jgi:predicted metal-dependent phosphoesterase TrpH
MSLVRLDLHVHTTASDGQYTPSQLVALARKRGLDVLGITDHDTTDGIPEARRAAGNSPTIIPGIELSAEDESGDVHILGYFLDIDNRAFQDQLAHFRADRYQRGEKIVARLHDLGMPIEWERVTAIAEGGAIGRPHIARALVDAGYVESLGEAFDRFLYNGGPAYVSRKRLSPEEAITLIHSAGGAAVLAHPGLVKDYLSLLAARLIPAGLDGIEVVHPKNDPTTRLNLRGIAAQNGLIMTGGSDFHRPNEDGSLALGAETPPDGCLTALRERARRYQTR